MCLKYQVRVRDKNGESLQNIYSGNTFIQVIYMYILKCFKTYNTTLHTSISKINT